MAKGGEIGDFGTGCQKHYALPWVTERPRCSSGVRGAARSLAHPPQEARPGQGAMALGYDTLSKLRCGRWEYPWSPSSCHPPSSAA